MKQAPFAPGGSPPVAARCFPRSLRAPILFCSFLAEAEYRWGLSGRLAIPFYWPEQASSKT